MSNVGGFIQEYNAKLYQALVRRECAAGPGDPVAVAIRSLRQLVSLETVAHEQDFKTQERIGALEHALTAALAREARLVRVVAKLEAQVAALAENVELNTLERFIDASEVAVPLAIVASTPTTSIKGN